MSLIVALVLQAQVAILTSDHIRSELSSYYGVFPSLIELNDRNYVVPSHEWFVKTFLPHHLQYLQEMGIEPSGEGMDCDNYSIIMKHLLTVSNLRGGRQNRGDIPCAIIKVRQVHPWANISNEVHAFHSLNLIRTDRGWFVVEPQNGSIISFEEYPNRRYITYAFF